MPNVFMKFLKICTLGGTLAIGAPGAQAQQASGPYIAARQAAMAHDYGFASEYFARALVQMPQDPTSKQPLAIMGPAGSGKSFMMKVSYCAVHVFKRRI